MHFKVQAAAAVALLISACNQPSAASGATSESTPGAATRFSETLPLHFVGEADCRLAVGGAVKIDGLCYVESDAEYGLSIRVFENEGKSGYFAILNEGDGFADGFWNGGRGSTHAHSKLGEMTRRGGCWTSNLGEICVGLPSKDYSLPARTEDGHRDLSKVGRWSCDGASGPFEMSFLNVKSSPSVRWGEVYYQPQSPFDYEGDDGFTYETTQGAIIIGQNADEGKPGLSFKIDASAVQMTFVSPYSGDQIICTPK